MRELKKGYCGVCLIQPKFEANSGMVMRNAHAFGADFIIIVGAQYKRSCQDTTDATKHIPTWQYADSVKYPANCSLVCVEFTDDSKDLADFTHPKQALYVFGPENGSIPEEVMNRADHVVKIPTKGCLNLGVSTGIVLYDRIQKEVR